MFGSRRFLKKVASRDSEKSLVGSVEETEQQARTPKELVPDDNKASFLSLAHLLLPSFYSISKWRATFTITLDLSCSARPPLAVGPQLVHVRPE